MKLIFFIQINIKLSDRLILLIILVIARYFQITQNYKIAKSLGYIKKDRNEVEFCAYELQSFL